jgi:hypothetical protein
VLLVAREVVVEVVGKYSILFVLTPLVLEEISGFLSVKIN